jgi:hypothetical protein
MSDITCVVSVLVGNCTTSPSSSVNDVSVSAQGHCSTSISSVLLLLAAADELFFIVLVALSLLVFVFWVHEICNSAYKQTLSTALHQ